jgi:serine/threonine-protein kinase PknG
LFEGDQLADLLVSGAEDFDVNAADWRVLPRPRIDDDDLAAPFLQGLPDRNPARALGSLHAGLTSGQVTPSPEVDIRRAWELIGLSAVAEPHRSVTMAALLADPDGTRSATGTAAGSLATPSAVAEGILRRIELADPWDWRVHWCRGVALLQSGAATGAAEAFSRVWTELPGETAPKMAVALAAELAGDHRRALQLYETVIGCDTSYVSAAFGLARCNAALSDHSGRIEALNRVPTSSAAHASAQIAATRALVAGDPGQAPDMADLERAAGTIERLQLDAAERAALSADVFRRALEGLEAGVAPPPSGRVLGREVSATSLRAGLEQAYRVQARLATTAERRVELIDAANAVRPRSLF